jgi:hypothetical protein
VPGDRAFSASTSNALSTPRWEVSVEVRSADQTLPPANCNGRIHLLNIQRVQTNPIRNIFSPPNSTLQRQRSSNKADLLLITIIALPRYMASLRAAQCQNRVVLHKAKQVPS